MWRAESLPWLKRYSLFAYVEGSLISTRDGRLLHYADGGAVSLAASTTTVVQTEWRLAANVDGGYFLEHPQSNKRLGDWLQINGRGIYGTRPGPFQPVDQVCCSTFNGNKVYVHVLDWGPSRTLRLPSLKQKIVASSILPGEAVRCVQRDDSIELSMQQESSGSIPVVVELILDAPLDDEKMRS